MVIPTQGREYVLRELHGGHPGMSRMKAIARTLVWWPHMDQDIDGMARRCEECQTQQASPPHAPLHPRKWPTRRWARPRSFCGAFLRKNGVMHITFALYHPASNGMACSTSSREVAYQTMGLTACRFCCLGWMFYSYFQSMQGKLLHITDISNVIMCHLMAVCS